MTFTIEKGIKYVSTALGGRGRKATEFPLADMEPEDSFLIECDVTSKKALDSWRRKLLAAKKRFAAEYDATGIVFRTSIDSKNDKKGLRVHRTA